MLVTLNGFVAGTALCDEVEVSSHGAFVAGATGWQALAGLSGLAGRVLTDEVLVSSHGAFVAGATGWQALTGAAGAAGADASGADVSGADAAGADVSGAGAVGMVLQVVVGALHVWVVLWHAGVGALTVVLSVVPSVQVPLAKPLIAAAFPQTLTGTLMGALIWLPLSMLPRVEVIRPLRSPAGKLLC